ncbi:hypothetical protein [Vibrio splendidus]|uniref:hypothetical protein n=1 Tax=Vibrio splendidus TaxID=29497 RepID=UPI002469B9D2|nr:hypothetical protein [Vibrio splendidus]MDH6017296.1 hypothetical protein [Vibrio splendidus]
MAISSSNFNTVVYLSDINTQCHLFKRSFEQLEIAAEHWINISNGTDDGTKFSPLNIISECTVCLSSMSAIKRMLSADKPPKAAKAQQRSITLFELLGKPSLDNVFSKSVRNSWEHHDERLDKVLRDYQAGRGVSEIYVSANCPKKGTLILKRFNPNDMSIHFLDSVVELKPCLEEINQLHRAINATIKGLHR